MPTPNEIPGVSLIDRLQAENKKLKDENTELQKSVSKLELFNKILEREITELKTPDATEPVAREVYSEPAPPRPPLPVKKIATYAVIGLLVIASLYAIASLFGTSKPSATSPVTETKPVPAAPVNKASVVPTKPATSSSTVQKKPLSTYQEDTSRRRRALMEDHTPYDSVAANDFSLGHFKVLSRAYFHTKPDPETRSELYINHLTRSTLEALDEKNGFVFVVFKNEAGKVTRGWLRKADLKEVSVSGRY